MDDPEYLNGCIACNKYMDKMDGMIICRKDELLPRNPWVVSCFLTFTYPTTNRSRRLKGKIRSQDFLSKH